MNIIIPTSLFQTIFVPQLLEDVPQITSDFSGAAGYYCHFDEMLGDQKGKQQSMNDNNNNNKTTSKQLGCDIIVISLVIHYFLPQEQERLHLICQKNLGVSPPGK